MDQDEQKEIDDDLLSGNIDLALSIIQEFIDPIQFESASSLPIEDEDRVTIEYELDTPIQNDPHLRPPFYNYIQRRLRGHHQMFLNSFAGFPTFPALNLYAKKFHDEDYELATHYFFHLREDWLQENDINVSQLYETDIAQNWYVSIEVKNTILEKYYATDLGYYDEEEKENVHKYPSAKEISDFLYTYRCNCTSPFTERQIKRVIETSVFIYGKMPTCDEFPLYLEYYILHGRIPNNDETVQFMTRQLQFEPSPEDFYQTDKIKVPALCVNRLPRYTFKEGEEKCCGICQYDFEENQEIIVLKPCNHEFHCKNENCLQNGSILTWLESNNFCPLCKTKVEL